MLVVSWKSFVAPALALRIALLPIAEGLPLKSGATASLSIREPLIIPLRREVTPMSKNGKLVSQRTSFSGIIRVGQPPQEFRVVFDTGSGQVVLPGAACESAVCMTRARYDNRSLLARRVNAGAHPIEVGTNSDVATIGFGTGSVKGELIQDRVCLGPQALPRHTTEAGGALDSAGDHSAFCFDLAFVAATFMSEAPFKSFKYDGIVGLGLRPLSLARQFNFLDMLAGAENVHDTKFGVFMAEGTDGAMTSEISFGGIDVKRIAEPLQYVPVSEPQLGYWMIHVKAVYVDGQLTDVCPETGCHGIVDTGTSHLGVSAAGQKTLSELLTRKAGDAEDCRLLQAAPSITIVLDGFNLTIDAAAYMRRVPQKEPGPALFFWRSSIEAWCTPKLMKMPAATHLPRDMLLFGEPLLTRYYTAFDWAASAIGFARHAPAA